MGNIFSTDQKCIQPSMEEEDWLSKLPEEVMVSILSHLTVEEAMATSLSRWRYLWIHVPCLNFSRPKFPKKLVHDHFDVCTKEVTRYINMVNRVLDLHKCPVLEEFSLSFPFLQIISTSAKCEVNKWLKFASSRKVQSLTLDFSVDNECPLCISTRLYEYSIPIELLFSFRTLKKFTLNRVNVDSQAVESLISSCPLLELLSITKSKELKHLKLVGPHLKLKHLVIRRCDMSSLEIRNVVNLVSVTYWRGKLDNFVLENVTSLLNLDVPLLLYGLVAPMNTTNFTQLAMLSLAVHQVYMLEKHFHGFLFPTLNNLKRLMLRLNIMVNETLVGITPILEAAPYLQKFTIEIDRDIVGGLMGRYGLLFGSISRNTMNSPHQHLKEIQYIGYVGDKNDVELATYLLENTLALEKFIVDAHLIGYSASYYHETRSPRDLAILQLQPIVPERVKLVIM